MIITIEGRNGEGKTTLAKEFCKGKKVYFYKEHHVRNKYFWEAVDSDVDLIVIDGVHEYDKTHSFFVESFLLLGITKINVILVKQDSNKVESIDKPFAKIKVSDSKKMRLLIFGLILLVIGASFLWVNIDNLIEEPESFVKWIIVVCNLSTIWWGYGKILKSDS